jgi:hypothetical protein
MPKAIPTREKPIADATVLPAGQLFVVDGKVVVNPTTQTATALVASLGASTITTIDVSARSGAFPSGLQIFETF